MAQVPAKSIQASKQKSSGNDSNYFIFSKRAAARPLSCFSPSSLCIFRASLREPGPSTALAFAGACLVSLPLHGGSGGGLSFILAFNTATISRPLRTSTSRLFRPSVPPFSSPLWGEGLCPIERPVDGRRTKRWGSPPPTLIKPKDYPTITEGLPKDNSIKLTLLYFYCIYTMYIYTFPSFIHSTHRAPLFLFIAFEGLFIFYPHPLPLRPFLRNFIPASPTPRMDFRHFRKR